MNCKYVSYFFAMLMCLLLSGCKYNGEIVQIQDTVQSQSEVVNEEVTQELTILEEEPYYCPSPAFSNVAYPEYVYSAEEWFDAEGHLNFPFEITRDIMQKNGFFSMLYVPSEALKAATTEDLLSVIKRWPGTRAQLYNNPSDYLGFLSGSTTVMNEFLQREDMVEVVLKVYQEDIFMVKRHTNDKKVNQAYKRDCLRRESGIVFAEILLATDWAFDQMDDEMRLQVLDAVEEKRALREIGLFECSESAGGFYTYIGEMITFDYGSKWYDYIKEQVPDNEEMLFHIDNYLIDWIN